MRKHKLKKFFNTLGYVSIYTQIMWLAMLFFPFFVSSGALEWVFGTSPYEPAVTHESTGVVLQQPFAIILGVAMGLLLLIVTVYSIRSGSRTLTRAGETSTKALAELVVPAWTHHKKIPKTQRIQLSAKAQYAIKITITLALFFITFATQFIDVPLSRGLAYGIAFVMCAWSVLWFTLAYHMPAEPKKTSRYYSKKRHS